MLLVTVHGVLVDAGLSALIDMRVGGLVGVGLSILISTMIGHVLSHGPIS